MNLMRQHGQVLIESLVIMALLALMLVVIARVVVPLQWQQQQRIDKARSILWRFSQASEVQASDAYAFANTSKRVLAPLQLMTPLSFATNNLNFLSGSEEFRAMARLTDAWLPSEPTDLTVRPAQLTPFSYANDFGLPHFQQVISWLYFTDEFAPDQLRLGYVNSDAAPLVTTADTGPGD
ncbi:hypothetical protein [Pseudidiomarina salilacus]|uniref:hypothetical protein n=1 Tax=Pseudidiomarina salilacus TaxID=3384452 RepID=UPI0039854EC5